MDCGQQGSQNSRSYPCHKVLVDCGQQGQPQVLGSYLLQGIRRLRTVGLTTSARVIFTIRHQQTGDSRVSHKSQGNFCHKELLDYGHYGQPEESRSYLPQGISGPCALGLAKRALVIFAIRHQRTVGGRLSQKSPGHIYHKVLVDHGQQGWAQKDQSITFTFFSLATSGQLQVILTNGEMCSGVHERSHKTSGSALLFSAAYWLVVFTDQCQICIEHR